MKPIISAFAFAGLFTMAACNNSAIKEKDAALQAQQHTIDSINTELARKRVIDSMNEVTSYQINIPPVVTPVPQQPIQAPAVASTPRKAKKRSTSSSRPTQTTVVQTQAPVVTQEAPVTQEPVVTQEAPVAQRKKGWSAKAKGALIGAGTGAAAGALINGRNRAAGAIIGGALGAGAGTGAGAIIDKKKGR